MDNKSIKKIIKTTLGLTLFLWLSYSIINQIKTQPELKKNVYLLFSDWNFARLSLLIVVVLLMCLNWAIEGLKWKKLIQSAEELSFTRALQSVFTGVAISMLTPNRIGEYMGRILYLKNVNKIKGITVTIIGSFAQLIVTGGFGILGIVYYILFQNNNLWIILLLFASIFLFVCITYVYFHLYKLQHHLSKFSFLKKHLVYLEIIKRIDKRLLISIIGYSTLRYLTYTLQFVLLLHVFNVGGPFLGILCTLFLIFWVMAIVPSIAIAEVGIRGETAIYFLATFTQNTLGVVSATSLLWFINLIIPALIGCILVYKIKMFDDEST